MTSLVRRPIRAALVVLLLAAVSVGSLPATEAEAATFGQRYEKRLVNRERKDRDRRALRLDEHLSAIAKRHSRRMANKGSLFHNQNLVADVGDRDWSRLGENVGVVPKLDTLKASLKRLHRAFMNSRAHRRNILHRDFRRIGVGIARSDGKVWVTLVFLG